MNRIFLGLFILIAVAGGAFVYTQLDLRGLTRQVDRKEPVTVSIYFGGEKSALLRNAAVQDILQRRYNVTLDATKAGSIEMATSLPVTGKDCIWPSNAVAVELARSSGLPVIGDDTIFNSPIVFYAWADIADALIAKGVVTQRNDGFLTADVAAIGGLIAENARWKEDLGVNVYGAFKVFSTHPAKSNSGNIWSGLLSTVLNDGQTPNADDLPVLLPKIDAYFDAMGHMEASSGDIFQNFLKQGMGARPIIVGYENQMIEFLKENANLAEEIADRVRIIYPEPTVFASHPLISLTSNCKRLTEALIDADLQEIAWAEHGFRTGLVGVQNDPSSIAVARVPESIDLVIPMPPADVMRRVIDIVDQ